MKCGFCGVVIPDGRMTIEGVPACKKCVVKGITGKWQGKKATPLKAAAPR